MAIINSDNLLQFKSSETLFDRIKSRLSSFDALNLIDSGEFHKHVVYVMENLGLAVYKECEAVLPVKDFKTKIPSNFKYFHLALRCTFNWKGTAKSINEQRPWIYYTDTEITECPGECCINCYGVEENKTKIVIRTFVNGDEQSCSSNTPSLLRLSSNVRDMCTEDCLSLGCASDDEITVRDGYIHSMFTDESIYLQYYGLPMDEHGLPMIPDNEHVEKAIEYYIIYQVFENMYWGGSVPGMGQMMQDVLPKYDFHMGMARYWAKLPSFASQVKSIRRQRSRNKFYNFSYDKTVV